MRNRINDYSGNTFSLYMRQPQQSLNIGLSHIGNDIVDLKTPEAIGKATNQRFIQRVLNLYEQQAVFNSDHPDSLLWALWAAKESAYKAVSKSNPNVSSAPGRYPVILGPEKTINSATGRVMTPNGIVPVKIDFHEDYVHCIGIFGPAKSLESIVYGSKTINPDISGAESISEKESSAVRKLAKKGIASCLQINEQDIQIIRHKKHNRINPPVVYAKGRAKKMDVSLSHDGRFAAYAFLADL